MGLFKKKKQPAPVQPVNSFNEPLDKLVDGDLPWGWVTYNKIFIDKIETEFNYFRESWVDARNSKDQKTEYAALKSFLLYMDDVQKLCDKKGECFSFWCSEYLINQDWRNKLINQLHELENK